MLNAGEAELVFCPYNYIIDPVIRAAMDVDISNAVLIFDEAHNIEDSEPQSLRLPEKPACHCLAQPIPNISSVLSLVSGAS